MEDLTSRVEKWHPLEAWEEPDLFRLENPQGMYDGDMRSYMRVQNPTNGREFVDVPGIVILTHDDFGRNHYIGTSIWP